MACSVPGLSLFPSEQAATLHLASFEAGGLLRGWWPPGPAESACLLPPPLSVYGGGADEANTVVGPGWLPHKISIQATLSWKTRGESRVRHKSRSGQALVQTKREQAVMMTAIL